MANHSPKNRTGAAKPQLQLIPPEASRLMAASLLQGAKHGPWNWRKQRISIMQHIGAIKRHLDAFQDGEWADTDDNSHLGAVMATAGIIADAMKFKSITDDRPILRPRKRGK